MRTDQKGYALVPVLILLALGSMMLAPTLNLAFSSLKGKQTHTEVLKNQYTRDAGAEYGTWELLYGGATALLTTQGSETDFPLVLNGIESTVKIRLQAVLGDAEVVGAEDNKIRPTQTVECDADDDGFDDDCLTLPSVSGMKARFTIFLDQVSPDTTAGIVTILEELPKAFTITDASSVVSSDGSFPEIVGVLPTDIGNDVWKWDFSASPISFTTGEVKVFSFTANIPTTPDRYCNDLWVKLGTLPSGSPLVPPNEHLGKKTDIIVLPNPPDGCEKGGFAVKKYSSQLVIVPGQTTVVTYIINVENLGRTPEKLEILKDVLPQGGFQLCSDPNYPAADPLLSCDFPKMKLVDTEFDPATDDFFDLTGFADWQEPNLPTYSSSTDRWTLVWDPPGAGLTIGKAGATDNNLIVRFQAHVTPTVSGSYYNESFIPTFPISNRRCPKNPQSFTLTIVRTLRNAVKHAIAPTGLPFGVAAGGPSVGKATCDTLWRPSSPSRHAPLPWLPLITSDDPVDIRYPGAGWSPPIRSSTCRNTSLGTATSAS